MSSLSEKIINGLREAKAFAARNPGQFRVSNYRVHVRKDRAAIINEEAGTARIVPLSD